MDASAARVTPRFKCADGVLGVSLRVKLSTRESELSVGHNAIDATHDELVAKLRLDPRRLPALRVRVHVLLPR